MVTHAAVNSGAGDRSTNSLQEALCLIQREADPSISSMCILTLQFYGVHLRLFARKI